MLQHSLYISQALRRTGTCILIAHVWKNIHKEPQLTLKLAVIRRHQQETSENLNYGFLKKFWVAQDAEIWQRLFLTQGCMQVVKLTCVILLQLQVLYRHAIRSPKGIKNLQEYGMYSNDTHHNQILNILFPLVAFILHNLKLWLLYKGKIEPYTLQAFKNCWISRT